MALVAGLIDEDVKSGFFQKHIPSSRLECKNHTQFDTKMITKMSLNTIPFEAAHTHIADTRG